MSDVEYATLLRWSRSVEGSPAAEALVLRSRIVLGCAEDAGTRSNADVASELGIWPQTVTKWRHRFLRYRIDGLRDRPRPGAPRKISGEQVDNVVAATRERAPVDGRRWSRAAMAAEFGVSPSTVGRIWKNFDLDPRREDSADTSDED
ncbi:helix-turn-helix domain-containing protein [Prauserella sp. ASG 168]|uniref:Helix-turn-helix domain-containing protein n=1 Tax=Prauserella cavernicola TaxID=2800127 RepID=A0A934QPQ2_9PSEU|nr:helix-turn-helix domain-containing protein [Prauserella cavernicola]